VSETVWNESGKPVKRYPSESSEVAKSSAIHTNLIEIRNEIVRVVVRKTKGYAFSYCVGKLCFLFAYLFLKARAGTCKA